MASVQGDVYALGVLLFQAMIGDFDQPLGIGWERRLDSYRAAGWPGKPDPSIEDRIGLLRDDIAASVDGDPSTRLSSAAGLHDRLRSLPGRIAERQALRRAQESAIRIRRLRQAFAATAAGLVVLGGLGAFAFNQWRRARISEQRAIAGEQLAGKNARQATENAEAAQRQSQLALETLHAVINDIDASLASLPASSPIRHRLLATALDRLEKLSGAFVNRYAADRETAVALTTMADLILRFEDASRVQDSQPSLSPMIPVRDGAVMTALKLRSRAIEILESHLKAQPGDGYAKRELAFSYERLGDVRHQAGDTAGTLTSFTRSAELLGAFSQRRSDR